MMNEIELLVDAIELLEACDCIPNVDNIKRHLEECMNNLYSGIGKQAHLRREALGIADETGITWLEQDLEDMKQIEIIRNVLKYFNE